MTSDEIFQALDLQEKVKRLSLLETINDYERVVQENPQILKDFFQYLSIVFEPENVTYYQTEDILFPLYLPKGYSELTEYCTKNLYCLMNACYKDTICHPYQTTYEEKIDDLTVNECINYLFYHNRRGMNEEHWKKGISKILVDRIIESI